MGTESNQSSDNSNQDFSLEDDRQRTGLFSWEWPENLMPPWSVPPGLLVPGPRQPESGAGPSRPAVPQPAASTLPAQPGGPQPGGPQPGDTEAGRPAADDDSWPGVAPPAGRFLHARGPRPPARKTARPLGTLRMRRTPSLERVTSEPLEPELHEPELHEPEPSLEPELHEPEWPVPEPDAPSAAPRTASQLDNGPGSGPGSVAWLWPNAG